MRSRSSAAVRGGLILLAAALASSCARHTPPRTPQPDSRAVRTLRADLQRVFDQPALSHALFGVEVRTLQTGDVLYALNPSKLVMPASNMKILTMAAAAERLGWDYTFTTRLVASAPVEDGVLRGDLIAVGGGDPSINSRDGRAARVFDELAAALQAQGIRSIAGRIIGDDDAFDDEGLGPGWSWDYLSYGYAAPIGALEFNENIVQLSLAPGAAEGAPATIELSPDDSGLTIVNRVVTGAKDSRGSIDLYRLPGRADLEIAGTIPAGADPIARTASVDNPTLFFARALRRALIARGIDVQGDAADLDDLGPAGPEASPLRELASAVSPPLAAIGTVLMKVSQNLYAETLLKTLGRLSPADAAPAAGASGDVPGTTERGRAVVREVLTAWGIPPDGYLQLDGSGLSRYNYVTAHTIVGILSHLHADPRHRDAFLATLPIAGRDGTIERRLRGTRAEANVHAKTGSIANVRALSGYLTTPDGEELVFSIVANHFLVPAATIDAAVDQAVERLADFTRSGDGRVRGTPRAPAT